MQITFFLFWTLIFIVFYAYIGYGLLLWAIVAGKPRKTKQFEPGSDFPSVVHIIAAYNEEDFIERKIHNSFSARYPEDKLKVIIITDGSSDNTPDIVKRFPMVTHLHQPKREGKVAAINRAVSHVTVADILVFSDANALINPDALILLTSHYADPLVGGVSGEKVVLSDDEEMIQAKGEGLYWKYESWLKKMDSDFYSVAGAAGELFSVRKKLYQDIPESIILDDLYLSLLINKKGYIIPYEPKAFASELPSSSIKDESKRRIRISAGAFQTLALLPELMNIFKHGRFAFQYISHRVLRWAVCPFALPFILLLNIIIVSTNGSWIYKSLLAAQVSFYLLACIGAFLSDKKQGLGKIFFIPFYFVFLNISVWAGFFRYLRGSQSSIWEKANRKLHQ